MCIRDSTRAVRRLRRFAQQDVERQPRLLHGTFVLRDVRLGRVDQAACLLQRNAKRAARAQIASSEWALRGVRLSLAAEVATTYFLSLIHI